MASTDARPVPRKNVAYRVTFPILDADGDLVTGAASLDSEVSIDGGTFADCTNEATEIATSSGVYFLDLTSGEMNGDTVAVIVKTGTAGAKTTTLVMYPEEAGDYRADVVQWLGTAVATPTIAGVPEVDLTHVAGATTDVSALATNVAAILVDTGTTLQGELDGIQTDTEDIQAKIGTPAGVSLAADIAAIEAQTDDIGAAGAGLTAVPWNAAWDAEVQSEVDDALVAHNLDHVAGTATGIPAIPAGTYIDQMMDDGTAVYDRTTDSLQAIRDNVGTAGAGLTAIDLPDQTMNITGNITGNLSGSVGSLGPQAQADVNAEVDTALSDVGVTTTVTGRIDAAVSTRATPAQVNTEIVDALSVDTYAEPTGVPGATVALSEKIGRIYQALRNKLTITATKKTFTDDSEAAIWEKDLADDGTTYSESEGNAP